MRLLVLLSCCLFLLPACSVPDFDRAGNRIDEFHRYFNDRDFDIIYNRADDELRHDLRRDDFIDLLANARNRLGEAKSSRSLGRMVWVATGGTHMTLDFDTMYENGEAREEFVYVMRDGEALLTGYDVKSAVLTSP